MAVNLLKTEAIRGELDDNLKSRATYLYARTGDEELLPIIVKIGKSQKEDYFDSNLIEILDSYYAGDYESTIDKCKTYI